MGLDEQAIREVHSAWIDAVNVGDLGHLLTLMADDVVFLNPGQAPLGRDGFSPPASRPPTNRLGSIASASWKTSWSSAKSLTR